MASFLDLLQKARQEQQRGGQTFSKPDRVSQTIDILRFLQDSEQKSKKEASDKTRDFARKASNMASMALETKNINNKDYNSKSIDAINQEFNIMVERNPEMMDELTSIRDMSITPMQENIDNLTSYEQDKQLYKKLEEESSNIIDIYSQTFSGDMSQEDIREKKQELTNFYLTFGNLLKRAGNYTDYSDANDYAYNLKIMQDTYSGLNSQIELLDANEMIINKEELEGFRRAGVGDNSLLKRLIERDSSRMYDQEKRVSSEIISSMDKYRENQQIIDMAVESGEGNLTSFVMTDITGEQQGESYNIPALVAENQLMEESMESKISSYKTLNPQLRDFRQEYPDIDIPWDKKPIEQFDDGSQNIENKTFSNIIPESGSTRYKKQKNKIKSLDVNENVNRKSSKNEIAMLQKKLNSFADTTGNNRFKVNVSGVYDGTTAQAHDDYLMYVEEFGLKEKEKPQLSQKDIRLKMQEERMSKKETRDKSMKEWISLSKSEKRKYKSFNNFFNRSNN